MQKEKRRPTLEELRSLPLIVWNLELCQLAIDAGDAGREDVQEEAMALMRNGSAITPEKIVALREKLTGATGGTQEAIYA